MTATPPPYPGAPRWVKVLGLLALVVILLVAVLLFTRGPGGRGPFGHTSPVEHGTGQP